MADPGQAAGDGGAELAVAAIHGRFQPFHLGHLEYLELAYRRSRCLYVGITNPDPRARRAEAASPHRHRPDANPYTYDQRRQMIRAAVAAAGLDNDRVAIVPFPISDPELWHGYVPAAATQFVRVYSAWESEKAERLRAGGYDVVEIAGPGPKSISATQVRDRIAASDAFDALVPPAVAELLASWNGVRT